MITTDVFLAHGFRPYECNYTKECQYKYDTLEYHITISKMTYGKDERHTCHIDNSDFSTIGFAFVGSIDDINMLLSCTSGNTLKLL